MSKDTDTHLTLEEKVLLHLLDFIKYSEDFKVPFSVTQQGIADAMGIYQGNVPRIIRQLSEQALVTCTKRHVVGTGRRKKSYFLTPSGVANAKAIKDSIPDTDWRKKINESPVIQKRISSSLTSGQFEPTSGLMTSSTQNEPLVNFIDDIPKISRFIGRASELNKLENWLLNDGRVVIISGIAGVGKTTLAAQLLNNFKGKRNLYWVKLYEWINVVNILTGLGEFLSSLDRNRLKRYLESKQVPDIWEVANILKSDFAGLQVLMVYDDVHMISTNLKSFFTLLVNIAEKIPGFSLVFLTRRPLRFYDERHTEVKKIIFELMLEGLDKKSCDEFLALKGVDQSDFNPIYKFTKGHPLALELLHSCDDLKMRSGSIYRFIRNEIFLDLDVPERYLLKSASVHRYPAKISAFLKEENDEMSMSQSNSNSIDNLLDRGLFVQTSQDTYNIHDLIREYIYADLTPQEVIRFHIQAAKYYNKLFSSDQTTRKAFILESMYHYLKASEYKKVTELTVKLQYEILDSGLTEQLKIILEELNEDDCREGWEDLLILKGNVYEKTGKWDDALRCFESCLKHISPSSGSEKVGVLYERLGKTNLNKNRWKESLGFYKKSMSIMKSFGNAPGVAIAERGIGTVLQKMGKYKEALPYHKRAMEVGKNLGDFGLIAGSYSDIARIYAQLGDDDASIANFKNCIEVSTKNGLEYELARAYYNISQVYHFRNEIDAALDNCSKSEKIHLKMGFVRETMWIFFNMGELYARKKDFRKSEQYIMRGAEISMELQDKMGISVSYIQLGIMHRLKGDYSSAKNELKKGVELAKKIGIPPFLADAYFEYGINFLRMKDKKSASDCFKKARDILFKIGAQKHYQRRLKIALE